MSFSDRTLTCRDCGQQFAFTAGEQEFYQSRGLTNDPGRCPDCRSARKSTRGDEIVEVVLQAPKVDDERTRELLRELAHVQTEDVRSHIWSEVQPGT